MKHRHTRNPKHVAVIGSGYVGLTTAAGLSHLGHTVTAIDIDHAKIAKLRAGHIPIHEPGLETLVSKTTASRHLRFDTDSAAASTAHIVMLCLPTPTRADGDLDLSAVRAAANDIGRLLRSGTIVTTKSTVPVGTHAQLEAWLNRPDVEVASNPEFLREGSAVDDFLRPDRIVVGAADPHVAQLVADLYDTLEASVHLTDPASAELTKYAANAFLATKLSFVNEMSRLCDATGADIDAVTEGLASDHRIAPAFLTPGPGWGGSCFPKDTLGVAALAASHRTAVPVSAASHTSNLDHLAHIAQRTLQLAPRSARPRIAVWGLTFKAGTDDLRDSPALAVIEHLRASGADIRAYDPEAATDQLTFPAASDPYTPCRNADVLLVLTEWPEFADADLDKVRHLLSTPTIYDTRAIIDPDRARQAGLTLHRPGRPTLTP